MTLDDLLSPDAVFARLRAAGKKQLLQDLAGRMERAARLPERVIFEALLERERLGTTGVGQGVAIPHAKLPGLARIVGLFARLEEPIDFEAIDDQPVDLVFLLLAPEGAGADHLKALARVSRLLRHKDTVEKLRATSDPAALYALLSEPTASSSHAA